jgi:hypothetical protein
VSGHAQVILVFALDTTSPVLKDLGFSGSPLALALITPPW